MLPPSTVGQGSRDIHQEKPTKANGILQKSFLDWTFGQYPEDIQIIHCKCHPFQLAEDDTEADDNTQGEEGSGTTEVEEQEELRDAVTTGALEDLEDIYVDDDDLNESNPNMMLIRRASEIAIAWTLPHSTSFSISLRHQMYAQMLLHVLQTQLLQV